jgi:xanthine dehydrogenase accessory factor
VFGSFPHVVVVGGGDLASALDALCATLGWPCVHATGAAEASAQLRELGSAAALVLLSHAPEVDARVLKEALDAGAGYVGALGSRHTQRQRAERLEQLGVDQATRSLIFGPIGLDLGARNPPETALGICAEILGAASGSVAGSLRDTDRPIHR